MYITDMDISLSSLTNADAGLYYGKRRTSHFQLPFSKFCLLQKIWLTAVS